MYGGCARNLPNDRDQARGLTSLDAVSVERQVPQLANWDSRPTADLRRGAPSDRLQPFLPFATREWNCMRSGSSPEWEVVRPWDRQRWISPLIKEDQAAEASHHRERPLDRYE
jgi:hypothetical protein